LLHKWNRMEFGMLIQLILRIDSNIIGRMTNVLMFML
jgi:hypothetical protein